jgi:hypothetical protein
VIHENKSEIGRLREQWALEDEAAKYTFAITARHDFIIARAQRGAEHILRLLDEGKKAEALALMNTEDWGQGAEAPPPAQKKHKGGKRKKRSEVEKTAAREGTD